MCDHSMTHIEECSRGPHKYKRVCSLCMRWQKWESEATAIHYRDVARRRIFTDSKVYK